MDQATASLTEVEADLAALKRGFAAFLGARKTAQLRDAAAAYTYRRQREAADLF